MFHTAKIFKNVCDESSAYTSLWLDGSNDYEPKWRTSQLLRRKYGLYPPWTFYMSLFFCQNYSQNSKNYLFSYAKAASVSYNGYLCSASEYKELRNCAVQTIENSCGPTASQLVHEEVVHTNGALLEWICSDVFGKCPNSAMMLASSAVLMLYSAVVLKMLF